MNFVLTLVVALIVGIIFFKLKVPGGLMIGAIFGVAAFNIITGEAYMPYEAKFFAQAISGAFIGVGISKNDLQKLKYLIKPAIIMIVGLLTLNLCVGFAIYFSTDIDLLTSFFIAVPGGMTDTPMIAAEMGADSATVALLQFVRLCVGLGMFPSFIQYMGRHEGEINKGDTKKEKTNYTHKGLIITGVAASLGAIIGEISQVPAGVLLFSLIATIIAKQIYNKCMMPTLGRRIAQIFAGSYIGTSMDYKDLIGISELIVPAIILAVGYFIACILIAKTLKKYCGFSLKEGMLCATPAGASDMALISADIGVSSPDVVVLQIVRLLSAVLLFPQIINIVYNLYNFIFT